VRYFRKRKAQNAKRKTTAQNAKQVLKDVFSFTLLSCALHFAFYLLCSKN